MEKLLRGGRVLLVADRALRDVRLKEVQEFVSAVPGPFTVEVSRERVEVGEPPLEFDHIWAVLRRFRTERSIGEDPVVCLVTKAPNSQKWFSATCPSDPRLMFVHADDIDPLNTPPDQTIPATVYVAHQVVENFLEAGLVEAGLTVEDIAHETTSGCVNDMCENKDEILAKLRSGDMCGRCISALEDCGATEALLRQAVRLLESCRACLLGTARYRPEPRPHDEYPYPVAVTRHKVSLARDDHHRFNLLLDHFDALVRYGTIASFAIAGRPLDLTPNPALGWWVDALGQSGREECVRARTVAEKHGIARLRNDTRGHGYTSLDQDPDDIVRVKETTRDIEKALRPLFAAGQLVQVLRVGMTDTDSHEVSMDRLHGSNTLFSPLVSQLSKQELDRSGPTRTKVVYLLLEAGAQFIPLDGRIERTECPACKDKRVLIVDRKNESGRRDYLDALVGHRVTL
jgi:hypothetical protein